MTLGKRLERLEGAHGINLGEPIDLDLAPDLVGRIEAAKAAGTFPGALSDDDQFAILTAYDQAGA